MDLFSKWCILTPIRKISASHVSKILEETWFRRYSVPEYIISDNASTFLSSNFKTLLTKYGVKHWATSRYHSQANPVERLNRTINSCIRSYASSDQKLWDTRISEIEFCLNNTPHTATRFSPYKILFGHEIVDSAEEHRAESDQDLSDEERIVQKGKIDKKIYSKVYNNLRRAHDRSQNTYNLRSKSFAPVFVIGQNVFRRNRKQSSAAESYNAKFDSLYLPATILARIGTSSYELADSTGKSIGVYSVTDLKPAT